MTLIPLWRKNLFFPFSVSFVSMRTNTPRLEISITILEYHDITELWNGNEPIQRHARSVLNAFSCLLSGYYLPNILCSPWFLHSCIHILLDWVSGTCALRHTYNELQYSTVRDLCLVFFVERAHGRVSCLDSGFFFYRPCSTTNIYIPLSVFLTTYQFVPTETTALYMDWVL